MIDKQASTSKAFCHAPVFFARFAIGRRKVLMSYNGADGEPEIESGHRKTPLPCMHPALSRKSCWEAPRKRRRAPHSRKAQRTQIVCKAPNNHRMFRKCPLHSPERSKFMFEQKIGGGIMKAVYALTKRHFKWVFHALSTLRFLSSTYLINSPVVTR